MSPNQTLHNLHKLLDKGRLTPQEVLLYSDFAQEVQLFVEEDEHETEQWQPRWYSIQAEASRLGAGSPCGNIQVST